MLAWSWWLAIALGATSALALGCSSQDDPGGHAAAAAGTGGGGGSGPATKTLGLNDVTMLVPMPEALTTVLHRAVDPGDDGTELVPRALYDRLNDGPIPGEPVFGPIVGDIYEALQIFAIRFDLCDRLEPGTCPEGDGRLRLVFQALVDTQPASAIDAAFHAFYTIPSGELPSLVAELRALSQIQNVDLATSLRVNPALAESTTGEYATRLRKLVTRYAGTNSLTRLTFFAQPLQFGAVRWVFRGVEKQGDALTDIVIVGIEETTQQAILVGDPGFEVLPVVDQPKGFALVVSQLDFDAAPAASQREALESLAAIDNPLVNTPETVQCASCHISTAVENERAAVSGIDPLALSARYASPDYDLTVPPITERTLRALGWLGTTPLIAQRTANESAQVAIEMDTRFPP